MNDGTSVTGRHLERAAAGERESLAWIVDRFDATLHAAAAWRLSGRLRAVCDPDDLVQEVWTIVLRRLSELDAPRFQSTPAFLAFLASTLRNLVNNLLRKHVLRGRPLDASRRDDRATDALDLLRSEVTSVTTRASVGEARAALAAALDRLDDGDRAVIVLRGIEQTSNQDTAVILGVTPNVVATRYRRARARLRSLLPDSIFDELGEA